VSGHGHDNSTGFPTAAFKMTNASVAVISVSPFASQSLLGHSPMPTAARKAINASLAVIVPSALASPQVDDESVVVVD